MEVNSIYYNSDFERQFVKLPKNIQQKAVKSEVLFRANPFHPSLRLHKLKGKLVGLWSISIDRKYRIIFRPQQNGDMLFISIGLHAIYEG
ncbi:type II toxin-antitoxin system mRNA interferase toxin, RelE/StbE family [Candidatus Peregrinibacteria bacterium CG_4_10_14_0_2_um_filter_41_8]|nr:MAG: type II toxin-antitoxin system mRNA interferase toxin, RelE/StbE family [Candidatus Peregrinibacteria bacterium CG_4_10_14_0_2_um_filter_41_8]